MLERGEDTEVLGQSRTSSGLVSRRGEVEGVGDVPVRGINFVLFG